MLEKNQIKNQLGFLYISALILPKTNAFFKIKEVRCKIILCNKRIDCGSGGSLPQRVVEYRTSRKFPHQTHKNKRSH
jgi:hypothetical protein